MKKEKYYIMNRNSPDLLSDYLMEVTASVLKVVHNKVHPGHQLLLIEKTIFQTQEGSREEVTNLWTMNEGVSILWQKHVKGRLMYDYTGIVYPLIHLNDEVMTFKQYNQQQNDPTKKP